MSYRGFEGKTHAKEYRQYRQKPPKEIIDRIISYTKEKYTGKLEQAVDLGCGSGQCTFLIAEHFEKVLGIDISLAQIQEANEDLAASGVKNIIFSVAPAEKIPLEHHSVQLITICTAAHLMDLQTIYEEGKRVLCPGGVMAIFSTEPPKFLIANDPSKNTEMEEIKNWVEDVLKEYFLMPVNQVVDCYKNIKIPYSDFTREYGFPEDIPTTLNNLIGNVKSYSGYPAFCEKKGQAAGDEFINTLKNKIVTLAGLKETDFDSPLFIHSRKFFLIMARV